MHTLTIFVEQGIMVQPMMAKPIKTLKFIIHVWLAFQVVI